MSVCISVLFLCFSLFIITAHRKLNEFITVADAFFKCVSLAGFIIGMQCRYWYFIDELGVSGALTMSFVRASILHSLRNVIINEVWCD